MYLFDFTFLILENLSKNFDQVSCKIRLLDDLESTLNFVNVIQNTGIKFFTVHLRKKDETAKVMANWKMMKEIMKIAKIPVYANGDIFCPKDIHKITLMSSNIIKFNLYLNHFNIECDGVMIARGAVHNPGIFQDFKNKDANNTTSLEDDLDNNNYEIKDETEETQDNMLKNKTNNSSKEFKKKNEEIEEDDVQMSNRLATILAHKYGKNEIDIIKYVKEYIIIVKYFLYLIKLKIRLWKMETTLVIQSMLFYIC